MPASKRRTGLRRGVGLLLALAGAGAWISGQAQAGYPSKPVHLVVGFAAGGPTDVVARALADPASRVLGQPFVVENRPGANTILAAQAVADAPADGYTLLLAATNHAMIPGLYEGRVRFDALRSFRPLCTVARSPVVLVVSPALGVTTLTAFAERVRKAPGVVTAGSPGVGSSGHFATEMYARPRGLQLNHVPYKGAAPMVTDLMGGQLDSAFATLGSVLPQIRSGRLVALAVAAPRRDPLLPQVPTFAEAGGGSYASDAWYGVLAPAGLPAPVAQKLEQALQGFAASAAGTDKLQGLGLASDSVCGAAFNTQMEHETRAYVQIARELDLKAD